MQQKLQSLLQITGNTAFPHCSELHGLVCAHAGMHGRRENRTNARELLRWMGEDEHSEALLEAAGEALAEAGSELNSEDLDFMPLLPSGESGLAERTESLAAWAGAYVSGLGVIPDLDLHGVAREAFEDLQQIAHAGLDAQADPQDPKRRETDERAWTELVEYVRIAAQLIQHNLQAQGAQPGDHPVNDHGGDDGHEQS